MHPQLLAATGQYEPSIADWVRAIKENPAYLLSFALYYWPWTLGITVVVWILFSLIRSSNSSGRTTSTPAKSWDDAAKRREEGERNAAETARRQKAKEVAGREEQARLHAAGTAPINRMVDQFIAAVRTAGNPEMQVKKDKGHWERAVAFKKFRDGRWRIEENPGRSTPLIEVYTDGSWSYQYWDEGCIGAGPGGDRPSDMRYICAKKFSGYASDADSYKAYADQIQELLVLFLRRHNIPLPSE